MGQYPLLQTKLYIPPVRPDLVSRPRLIERLNAGLPTRDAFSHALTLISAPAGFGKTTLVSEWAHKVGVHGEASLHVAWLSLDEGDNDPARFLAYMTAALRTIEANIGKGALSALQSPQPPSAEAVLISLINDVASIPHRIILILDDYHIIDSSPVDDALTFLLEHLPPQMHLFIATRDDPHLPLARLRARGQLTELRASDLRFSTSEAAVFLNQVMGLDLSAKDIAALETRTEGWIAGLQLAALALQGLALQGTISMPGRRDTSSLIKSFTGSHRFVLDYLIEEVLEQQPESIQTFLPQTAILDRLTGSLCDALTGQDHGQATLEMLERANLFIVPLDEERRWYRYHHLFADLLRQRLRQTQSEEVPMLHRRASEWYEQNGLADEAIEHALRAGDFERAACLLEEHVDAIWQRGEHTKLRRWLAGLPVELVFSKPHLCILHAWELFTSGQQDAAEGSLQAAEEALDTCTELATEPSQTERDPLPGPERSKIQGRAAAIRAFLAFYRGDAPAIYKYSRQALEYLPEQDLTWRSTAAVALGDAYSFVGEMAAAYRVRLQALEASKAAGNTYMILIASMKLVITMRHQGRLAQAIKICQRQLQLADESGLSQTVVVGWLLAIWGEVLAELNDLDGAIDQARRGTELTARGRDLVMIGWSNLCLMRVLVSRGDLAGAQEIIDHIENIAREHHVPPWIMNLMAARQARIWLYQGRLDSASQWVKERRLDAGRDPSYLHEAEHIALARILIAQGRLDETTELLQRLLEATEMGGRTSRAIEILMLQALTYQAGDDTARATTTLERALTLAEPGGFIRIFVDEGPPMARLLCTAAAHGIMPDYTAKLLAAFETTDIADAYIRRPTLARERPDRALSASSVVHRPPASARVPVPSKARVSLTLVEPLSERELEVLQLVAEGLTNREIASRLFLTLNTVKAHTRNIYGKLEVHSRTQAVAKGRALGIMPSI